MEASDVASLFGAYHATNSVSMRVKIVGCLGPIAMRQGAIDVNKVNDESGITMDNTLTWDYLGNWCLFHAST